MREMKFRQWYQEEFFYWGFNVYKEDGVSFTAPVNSNKDKFPVYQFTGLKDKNGVEIYEGDIVKFDDGDGWEVGTGTVSWSDFFGVEFEDVMYSPLGDNRIREVIGNIHENPELLK